MKNKKNMLVLIFLFVFLLAGASLLYERLRNSVDSEQLAVQQLRETTAATSPSESEETLPRDTADEQIPQAPDFTVYDEEGNAVKLYDYFGKPIVLNFWASWCGPCKMEMPDFEEKYLELGNEVQFLMVNMTDGSRETVETASGFIAGQGYTFPVFYDADYSAAMAYGIYSLPTTYFIDADGHAIARATGAISAENLQKGIDMILP